MRAFKRIFYLSLFAVAMAYLEAAVVVYLRELYYPANILDIFPAKVFTMFDYYIELGRELATLVMLFAAGMLSTKNLKQGLMGFLYAWGVWDIFYYVWLYVTIGWPRSLFEWDILFLIPLPWFGPVITPVLIALLFVIVPGIILMKDSEPTFSPKAVATILIGGLFDLYAFLEISINTLRIEGKEGFIGLVPQKFNWPVYLIGLMLMAYGFYALLEKKKRKKKRAKQSS